MAAEHQVSIYEPMEQEQHKTQNSDFVSITSNFNPSRGRPELSRAEGKPQGLRGRKMILYLWLSKGFGWQWNESRNLLGACATAALLLPALRTQTHYHHYWFLIWRVCLIRQLSSRPYPVLSIFQVLSPPSDLVMLCEAEKWLEPSNQTDPTNPLQRESSWGHDKHENKKQQEKRLLVSCSCKCLLWCEITMTSQFPEKYATEESWKYWLQKGKSFKNMEITNPGSF